MEDRKNTSENNSDTPEEKKSFFARMLKDFEVSRKEKIRDSIEKKFNQIEQSELTNEEMNSMYSQFGTYASLQLLRLTAIKLYGDKANHLINEIIEGFISQGKQTLMVKHQIDSVEMQGSKLNNIIGEDLIEKEREIVAKRVDKIYDAFRTDIKQVLLIDDVDSLVERNEDEDEDEDNNFGFWE